jgi:hypothetical protein
VRFPACHFEKPFPQRVEPCSGFRRDPQLHGRSQVGTGGRFPGEVDLVDHPRPGNILRQARAQRGIRLGILARRLDEDYRARVSHRLPRARDSDALDLVTRLPQPRGIDEMHGHAAQAHARAHIVARCAGDGSHDGELLSRKLVQQARLADIWPPYQHGGEAVSKEHSLRRLAKEISQRLDEAGQGALLVLSIGRVDLFFRKIDARLHMRAQIGEAGNQPMDPCRKGAGERTHRASRGFGAGGIDEVGDAFGLREVDPVVEECPVRELARLRDARSQLGAALQQLPHHHRPAMPLQLQDILAGI